jgi:large subunit ribosomal protein L25
MTVSENVINAASRTVVGSNASRRLRKLDGKIPGIVYSLENENLKISIDTKEWNVFSKKDVQVIQLQIDKQKPLNVLLRDVQFNVLSNTTLHIDLQEIDMKEEITSTVSVYPQGTAAGFTQGGILSQPEHEIEVSCLPINLPESIEVDITALELDETILAGSLILPANVKLESDPDMLILRIAPPKIQDAEEDAEAEGDAEVEAGTEPEADKE